MLCISRRTEPAVGFLGVEVGTCVGLSVVSGPVCTECGIEIVIYSSAVTCQWKDRNQPYATATLMVILDHTCSPTHRDHIAKGS